MNRQPIVMGLVTLIALGCSGCAASNQARSFDTVSGTIEERIAKQVAWDRGNGADEQLEQSVDGLLANELTADDAVQIALLRNRTIQATYEELSIGEADLIAAGLLSNPVFDGEVRFESGGSGTALELAVVQEFLNIFFIPLRKRIAGAALDESTVRVTVAVLDLAGEVRRRYYGYQAAEQLFEMRHTVLSATEASYDLATRLHEAGNITALELANERALYEQSKLSASAAEVEADVVREQLNALMGLWGEETSWKTSPRLPNPVPFDVTCQDFERNAVARSLDLEVARVSATRAAARLGLARPFAIYDEADIGVSGEREVSGEWTVGPAFSVPIPLFNQGQAAVMGAQANLRQAQERYAAVAVEIRAESRAVHRRVTLLYAQAQHYVQVVLTLRHQIVEETQKQYNAMQVGAFQLLQAKQQEIEAGAAYVATLRDYWLARTDADQIASGARVRFDRFERDARHGVQGRGPGGTDE